VEPAKVYDIAVAVISFHAVYVLYCFVGNKQEAHFIPMPKGRGFRASLP
jgi:hypothetical protein